MRIASTRSAAAVADVPVPFGCSGRVAVQPPRRLLAPQPPPLRWPLTSVVRGTGNGWAAASSIANLHLMFAAPGSIILRELIPLTSRRRQAAMTCAVPTARKCGRSSVARVGGERERNQRRIKLTRRGIGTTATRTRVTAITTRIGINGGPRHVPTVWPMASRLQRHTAWAVLPHAFISSVGLDTIPAAFKAPWPLARLLFTALRLAPSSRATAAVQRAEVRAERHRNGTSAAALDSSEAASAAVGRLMFIAAARCPSRPLATAGNKAHDVFTITWGSVSSTLGQFALAVTSAWGTTTKTP